MVNRRQLLVGLGGLVVGGGVLIGTGAFTTIEAERTVSVETAGDADALLGIAPFDGSENDDYVNAPDDGTVEINITEQGTSASGAGVNKNAITAIDRLLQVTNNGTQDIVVGFNAVDQGDYGEDELPGGWGYAVSTDEDAAVVIWASPLPSDMTKSLEKIRPDLTSTGFDGTSLVDGRIDDEVDNKADRTIAPGEQLHIGAIVDTRESTVEGNPIPEELTDAITLLAESTDP